MTLKMDIPALTQFLQTAFAQVADDFQIEKLSQAQMTVRMKVGDRHLRPGGTISGPSMFSVADVSAYLMTLARIGPEALAVTTNCSIDFMRKPSARRDLIAQATLLKLGRHLSVTDVLVYSDGVKKPVARASLTYSLPPSR